MFALLGRDQTEGDSDDITTTVETLTGSPEFCHSRGKWLVRTQAEKLFKMCSPVRKDSARAGWRIEIKNKWQEEEGRVQE